MIGVTPTAEQTRALNKIEEWYREARTVQTPAVPRVFLLDGGAGTGKTLTASLAAEQLGTKKILFGAYTGKAAKVMASKGMKNARTLHSMLYYPHVKDGVIVGWVLAGDMIRDADLLVVDECSMLPDQMANEIYSFNTPVLALGDVQGQLPPPKGCGAFVSRKPDAHLSELHRTGANSPIDRLAWIVRKGGAPRVQAGDGEAVFVKSIMDPTAWDDITGGSNIVICGKHTTRYTATRRCRARLGAEGPTPRPGEPLICCRNDYRAGLVNGDMAVVWRIVEDRPSEDFFVADLLIDGDQRSALKISRHLFQCHFDEALRKEQEPPFSSAALFDWGYAITAHKAQGSEWPNVCVIDDQFMRWDADMRRRWLYTAVTRASEKLTIITTGGAGR